MAFTPSYTFRNRENGNVALTPAMKDENGKLVTMNPIFINVGQRYAPRTELEQTFLLKHKRVLSGSIIAERIVPKVVTIPKEAPVTDEAQETPIAELSESTTQTPEPESTDDELFEKAQLSSKKALIESVTNLPSAIKVMKDLGFTEKFNRASELKEFAFLQGIKFPNWK